MLTWLIELSVWDKLYMAIITIVAVIMAFRYHYIAPNIRPFLWLSIVHLIVEVASNYISYNFHRNNLFIYHILAPTEYLIICLVFYKTFTNKFLKKSIIFSAFFYVALTILLAIFWEKPNQNNSTAFMVESILVTLWCFLFFRFVLQQGGNYRPEKDRFFWVVVSLLFYFIGNFFVMGLMNYFVKYDMIIATKVYYAGYSFYYVLYSIIGLVCLLKFPMIRYC